MCAPILAAGLSGYTFFFGIFGLALTSRIATIFMTLLSGLALLATFIVRVFIIDMILLVFGIVRQRNAGNIAQHGNAN